MPVRFEWNGRQIDIDDQAAPPHVNLLAWLRTAGGTGSKEGCAEGECGACAVAFVERDAHGNSCFLPVNSCLVSLPSVHGRSIVSVEGVAAPAANGGALHPVQRALVEHAGSQCGYCTPGFVVSMFCEYYRAGGADFDPEALSGNLCRCTGYSPIVSAGRSLGAPQPDDPQLAVLRRGPAALSSYRSRSTGYAYLRPRDFAELFELWSQHPAATLLAGGSDLMVYANQRDQRYETLIALDGLDALRSFACDDEALHIGAGLTLSDLHTHLHQLGAASPSPLLEQLLPLFASRLIRNRATLGGNLATASPIGDAAPVLLALDAELTLLSAAGRRTVPLHAFFTGYRKHVLAPQELILSVNIPRPTAPVQRFYKVSKRVLDDISTVAAAFALELTPARTVKRLRAAYGGIAATPLRAFPVEQLVQGRAWNRETCSLACAALSQLVRAKPIDDHRGSAAYREALVPRLFEKFFVETSEAPP